MSTLERQQNRRWLTPGADYLFWELRDSDMPKNKAWAFGDRHPNIDRFPNHVLVMVGEEQEVEGSGTMARWYYAADRANEDDYNWQLQGNDTVFRQYLVRRADYPPETYLEVGTADVRFPDYVFAGESVAPADGELNSLYVMVTRTFSIPALVTYQWDEAIQRSIKITREIVKAGTVTGSGGPGWIIEVKPGDKWYDLKITSEVQWGTEDNVPVFPIALDSIAADANFQFPLLLKTVQLFGAWAYAASDGAAASYSEDFFFEVDTVEPHPGPFEATILRFLTDDPDSIRMAYPTTKIASRAETFGLVKWWASASDSGNNTFALARQYNTPATVHDNVPLPAVVNYTQGGNLTGVGNGPGSQELPATPGFSTFIGSTTTIAGVDTKRTRMNLWEVQVQKIWAGGATVYNDTAGRGIRPGTGSGNLPPPGGGGSGAITLWNEPIAHVPTAVNPQYRTHANGGTAAIKVWATEAWTWDILGATGITSSWPVENPANYPQGMDIGFTYPANNTGSDINHTIRFTTESGFSILHLVSQPSN